MPEVRRQAFATRGEDPPTIEPNAEGDLSPETARAEDIRKLKARAAFLERCTGFSTALDTLKITLHDNEPFVVQSIFHPSHGISRPRAEEPAERR